MAIDDSQNYAALRERMEGKLTGMGYIMGPHEVAAVNNGFPPEDYAAINPASYQAEVISGEIAMVDTCFAKLASELHEIHGEPKPLSATASFGSVSIEAESNQPDQQLTQNSIDNPFEVKPPEPGFTTGDGTA